MVLEKKPFVRYNLEKKADAPIAVKLNEQEREMLVKAMKLLRQPKKSTALKQLALIGYAQVILDKKVSWLLDILFENERRNRRIGIENPDVEIEQLEMQK